MGNQQHHTCLNWQSATLYMSKFVLFICLTVFNHFSILMHIYTKVCFTFILLFL